MKLRSMKHVLSAIKRCDVIIKNGQEQFVGLYYDKVNFDRPMVLFKCDWGFNYYLSKVLDLMPVPCIEHKRLARALFDKTEEGDYIDTIYFSAVASIYMNLPDFNNENKDDFGEELNRDVVTQLYQLEADICKSAEKDFLEKEAEKVRKKISIEDTKEQLHKNITKIAEEYGMDYKVLHNTKEETDEFYLETLIEEYDFDLWLMVMLSTKDKKLYVCNRCIFKCFDLCETDAACKFVKFIVQTCNGRLKKTIKTYCEEFKLNPRIYDIAKNSIKTMLEMNYNWKGIEYGIDDSMKTQVVVYLKEKELPDISEVGRLVGFLAPRLASGSKFQTYYNKKTELMMYEVCITYNEFIRNPEAFKKLIEEPRVLRKWNFWSRRKKYKQEFFDERFQTIAT